MPDPFAAAGLASSIITFLEFAIKVGKRTAEYSKYLGNLPPDLQSCKDVIDILKRSAESMQTKIQEDQLQPITAAESDLELLFRNLAITINEFLSLLDGLMNSKSLSRAIKIVRKEGKIKQLRENLDHYVVILLFLFHNNDAISSSTQPDTRDLRNDFLKLHQSLESRMSLGFAELGEELNTSRAEILAKVQDLSLNPDTATETPYVDLILGQQDITNTLHVLSENIVDAQHEGTGPAAEAMTKLLQQNRDITQVLSSMKGQSEVHGAQIQRLAHNMERALASLAERSDSPKRASAIYIKAEFEFAIRSDILTMHIHHCTQWASNALFSRSLSWSRLWSFSPFSRPTRQCTFPSTPRCKALNIMAEYKKNEYHLIRLDLSSNTHDGDVVKYIMSEYTRYRGSYWTMFGLKKIRMVEYVKFEQYSESRRCFTKIAAFPRNQAQVLPDQSAFAYLLSSHEQQHIGNQYVMSWIDPFIVDGRSEAQADPISDGGNALMLSEGFSFLGVLIASAVFMLAVHPIFCFLSYFVVSRILHVPWTWEEHLHLASLVYSLSGVAFFLYLRATDWE